MIDPIEEAIEVAIGGPLEPISDGAPCALHRLMRRAPRAEAETPHGEAGVEDGMRTCGMACWISRSRAVGTPSSLVPPSGFGIVALRMGWGR